MHGAGRPASKRASSSPGRRPLALPPVRLDWRQQQQHQQKQLQPPGPRRGLPQLAASLAGQPGTRVFVQGQAPAGLLEPELWLERPARRSHDVQADDHHCD